MEESGTKKRMKKGKSGNFLGKEKTTQMHIPIISNPISPLRSSRSIVSCMKIVRFSKMLMIFPYQIRI